MIAMSTTLVVGIQRPRHLFDLYNASFNFWPRHASEYGRPQRTNTRAPREMNFLPKISTKKRFEMSFQFGKGVPFNWLLISAFSDMAQVGLQIDLPE